MIKLGHNSYIEICMQYINITHETSSIKYIEANKSKKLQVIESIKLSSKLNGYRNCNDFINGFIKIKQ